MNRDMTTGTSAPAGTIPAWGRSPAGEPAWIFVAEDHPDADLLRLGAALERCIAAELEINERWTVQEMNADKKKTRAHMRVLNEGARLCAAIEAARATTVEGLRVKARAHLWRLEAFDEKAFGEHFPRESLVSLLRDLGAFEDRRTS